MKKATWVPKDLHTERISRISAGLHSIAESAQPSDLLHTRRAVRHFAQVN